MPNQSSISSPNTYARIGGIAYLIIIVAGLLGEMFIRNSIIVSGDAAATAQNLAASTKLWRLGIAGDLLMHVCDLIVLFAYVVLFWPVNKKLILLAIMLNLVQTAVLVANKINLIMPLFFLSDDNYLRSFNPQQLQSLSYLFIKAHSYGFGVGLIFFGCASLITGYIIRRSGFLPGVLGLGMQIAGVCYLVNSFALILAPTIAQLLFPAILLPPFIAELSLSLWLIIKGVDVVLWKEKAAASSL
jgi:hypothetical protein